MTTVDQPARWCPARHLLPEREVYCRIHNLPGGPVAPDQPTAAPGAGSEDGSDVSGGPASPGTAGEDATVGARDAPPAAGTGPGADDDSRLRCPSCAQPVPNAANTVCLACGESLTPPELSLCFGTGRIDLRRGTSTMLGRDPKACPWYQLFAGHLFVSRRHATVGVHAEGGAWIRNEQARNDTLVNGIEIPSDRPTALCDGDRIQLASDVELLVTLRKEEPDD